MRLSPTIVALLAGVLSAGPAASDEPGNAQRGLEYAQQVCASCHSVRLQELKSPVAEAPPLKIGLLPRSATRP